MISMSPCQASEVCLPIPQYIMICVLKLEGADDLGPMIHKNALPSYLLVRFEYWTAEPTLFDVHEAPECSTPVFVSSRVSLPNNRRPPSLQLAGQTLRPQIPQCRHRPLPGSRAQPDRMLDTQPRTRGRRQHGSSRPPAPKPHSPSAFEFAAERSVRAPGPSSPRLSSAAPARVMIARTHAGSTFRRRSLPRTPVPIRPAPRHTQN